MKTNLFIAAILATSSAFAFRGQDGNGGDASELVFRNIASNIGAWISSGNADALTLPAEINLSTYKTNMQEALSSYRISFTPSTVTVNGVEKTCRNWIDDAHQKQILCNTERFKNVSTDQQYQLVHHELAGLAGIETSQYEVSKQISAYLQNEVVRRLPVVLVEKSPEETRDVGIQRYMAGVFNWDYKEEKLAGACDRHDMKAFRDRYFKSLARELAKIIEQSGRPIQSTRMSIVDLLKEKETLEDSGNLWITHAGKVHLSYKLKNGVVLDTEVVSGLYQNVWGKPRYTRMSNAYGVGFETVRVYDKDGRIVKAETYCNTRPLAISVVVRNSQTKQYILHVDRQETRKY